MNLKAKKVKKAGLLLVLFYVSLSFVNRLEAQAIKGIVLDKEDGNGVPLVNIYNKRTSTGAITDFDGNYTLDLQGDRAKKDSIVFSCLGYDTRIVAVKDLKKASTIYLEKGAVSLNEVVLFAEGTSDYQDYLMQKIIKNKKFNDPGRIGKYQSLETSLLSVFLANLDDEIIRKRRFRKSEKAFIKDSDSTVMMPVLFTKEIIRHRIDKSDNLNESKILKIEQEGTLEQLSSLVKETINKKITQDINFYDDNIDLLGRSFQSPIGSNYKSHYKIHLSDSMNIDGVKHYEFLYYPKNEKSVAFDGSFLVDSESFALKKIDATLPALANINFIKKLNFDIEYDKTKDNVWYVKVQKTNTTFSFLSSKKKNGRFFSVQKNQKYSNFKLDFDATLALETEGFAETASENLVNTIGTAKLDSTEIKALSGIRKLKKNNHIKFLDRFGAMSLNGFYNMNKFDLGPYFDFYIKNGIEGSRFTLPIRTSEKMFDNFTVGGFLGYGAKDKKFKYGFNSKYKFRSDKNIIISANYFDDYNDVAGNRYLEFVRENPFSKGGGNVLSVFNDPSRLNFRLLRKKHVDVGLSYEPTENSRYLFRPFYEKYQDNEYNRFIQNGTEIDNYTSVGVLFDYRYSRARNYDQQFFSRIYFGTTKPVYHFTVEVGNNKITDLSRVSNNSEYYARLNVSMKKKFLIGPAFLKLYANVGYLIGKVPYPLLNNPSGNQSIGLARFNYNLLNPVSFSSDTYTNLHLSFNGGGFLFNKIPFISALNLRESLSFKSFYGSLRDEHNSFFKLPEGLEELRKEPYLELGIGVTNIFKVLRIEYVRRLNAGGFYDAISNKGALRFRIEVGF